MLQLLVAILGILITIFLVVGIHEFGHFIVARLVHVKVQRFSIGFGKAIYRWHDKKGTEYVIAPIPLGGYVKLLDENEDEVPPADRPFAFNNQPFYKKFAIVAAGPLFNLIFAFVLYWILFIIGFTNLIPVTGNIIPNSIAAQAGMQPKQEIIQVDHQNTRSWISVVIHMLARAGDQGHMVIETKNSTTKKTTNYSLDLTDWHMNDLKPDPLESLGITPYQPIIPAVIDEVFPGSPADKQLQSGDKIVMINQQKIENWIDLITLIEKHPNTWLGFTVDRQGQIIQLKIKIGTDKAIFSKKGYLGISTNYQLPPELIRKNQYDPLTALSHAWQNTRDFCTLNFLVIGKLLTGKISLASLGGPITIFESAGTALNNGIAPFLSFLAFLSISIGLINVLPIPGLDGGLMLFQVIELIIRRPIPLRFQMLFYRLGFIFIFLLITQALVNDILRL